MAKTVCGGQANQAAGFQPPVCVFSKHLQFLDYQQLAKTCREIGLDGVDLTVRRKGHVLPENVARDLPRAVEAIRAEGLEVPMITTTLRSGEDPTVEPILKTAAKLGIKYFRIGGHKYDGKRSPLKQLPEIVTELKSLAQLAERYGMSAGYHNHSGPRLVGGAIWDLQRILEAVGSANLGSNFDVGHATIEGAGGAWEAHARLLAPQTKMMAVKDFVWRKNKRHWVRLGQGVTRLVPILKIMRQADFSGPISIHVEYRLKSQQAMIEEVRETVLVLREAISQAAS